MKYSFHWLTLVVGFILAVCLRNPTCAAQTRPADDVEQRVDRLLSQLTLTEKLGILGGTKNMFTIGVPRLGIPSLKMADGPLGTRTDGSSTAFPAGAALAATWDVQLADHEGICLGRNARSRGDHILLGPAMNIYREPQNGRNFEYFGEDPFLAGQIAAAYVRGVQSQSVAACVKHFVCNNQETQRDTIDAIVDERTLREIYLPAFEAAVKQGHARAVMAAYNQVNGSHMSANDFLLNDVLKDQWKFDGVVMSDWGATHDTLAAASAGLDLEMPSGQYFNPAAIWPLMQSGKISQATIDEKIRRLLRLMIQMGWMDHPQIDPSIPRDDAQSDDTALAVAQEGMVLLKNQGNLLPLDWGKIHSLVLVGPEAGVYVHGGGSSEVKPLHPTTIMDSLWLMAPSGVHITQVDFHDPLDEKMTELARGSKFEAPGLQAEFFDNMNLSGAPALKRVDSAINFNWHEALPAKEITSHAFSARWSGTIRPQASGEYTFAVRSDDGSRIVLDGKTIVDDWSDHAAHTRAAVVNLKAGRQYDLKVEYYNSVGVASIQFGWQISPPVLSPSDRAAIAGADAVIACVGPHESEGEDRSYGLPLRQEELLEAVSAVNPKTIVVLSSGGNVAMSPWIDHVPALLDAWYGGQDGGLAVATILFGEFNPSGRLPDTFEKKWEDAPAYGNYPGSDGKVNYAEGIYVGYRWFDKKGIEPRFCFGSGLSYTTFSVENLKIVDQGQGENRDVDVSVDVTNTGPRAGAEVVQLYVRPPAGGPDRAMQELKGFGRVDLEPGETHPVTMRLDARSFSYWDVNSHGWKITPGEYQIAVGRSSRDICVTGKVVWK